jgi:hypothetical protein
VSPYANETAGRQITADGVRTFLKERVGFDLPLYAVEQLFPTMQQYGFVEYIKTTKRFMAKAHASNFQVTKKEIESDYDGIVAKLSQKYGSVVKYVDWPPFTYRTDLRDG